LESAIFHYNDLTVNLNPQLDQRLRPAGNPQKLNMTQLEVDAVVAFLKTLTGSNVYVDKKWSDPFIR
jgi:cytochrome c peroxidase